MIYRPTERYKDLPALKEFVDGKLLSGGGNISVDEVVALREIENQTEQEREDNLEAIREGFADLEAGRTRPFEAFDREFRPKRAIPPRSGRITRRDGFDLDPGSPGSFPS